MDKFGKQYYNKFRKFKKGVLLMPSVVTPLKTEQTHEQKKVLADELRKSLVVPTYARKGLVELYKEGK